MDTGPVIKLPVEPVVPLLSSRWRTLPPDTRRPSWVRGDRERCSSTCGDDRRCMLRENHLGLHAWRSMGGLRVFEWG